MVTCPICKAEVTELRSISIGCLISQPPITIEKEEVLVEIPKNSEPFGISRWYSGGFRDEFIIDEEASITIGNPVFKRVKRQLPETSIRVIERTQYKINCCVSCRQDFTSLILAFASGEYVG